MFFLVDNDKKIIFGWSAKCGCSHIKRIYWFLQTDNLENLIHTPKDINEMPNDIENYTTLIFIRNPYKRIISGFLDKYRKHGEFRHLWKNSFLSFSQFVDKLINRDWKTIDYHHFTPQTTEKFNKKILLSKNIKFYDICKIDYEYIEQLYNKKIPEYIINKKEGHERISYVKTECYYNKYVYDLHIDDYIDYNIDRTGIYKVYILFYLIIKVIIHNNFYLKILLFF